MTRLKYELVSADAHILEPPDLWTNWLPEKYQDRAPKLVKDEDGGDAWLFHGATQPNPIGLVSTPGRPWDQFQWTGVTYEIARDGCYDGQARLADMDEDGVDAEILFAPQRTISHFLGDPDEDFVAAGVKAYNDFLWEEFCAPDRERLIGLAQISSLGIDHTVQEVYDAAERGFKGVVISCWPSGNADLSEEDDRFWAACVETGLTVTNHITLMSREARVAEHQASAGRGSAEATTKQGRNAAAKAVGGMGSVFRVVPPNLAHVIMTGVFDRFPDLKFVFVETGVGWVPHFLEQMDDRYWRNKAWAQLGLEHEPSHYWYRNCGATFIWDPAGIRDRHAVGVGNMMWSTDYPHHGNDWPYSRKTLNDTMGHIPGEEQHAIQAGNAVRWFDLPQRELKDG